MPTFGPVPSRRLGQSLGINNIPPKICSYSCVYCQIGKTLRVKTDLQNYYSPEQIFKEVEEKVKKSQEKGEKIDYLTFVPDGEPTLDINLGQKIHLIKSLGIKTAVITNASLLDREQVRDNLQEADLVSLKIDAVQEEAWRKVNRPHHKIKLESMLKNILYFAKNFPGEIITETMLISNLNDSMENVMQVAAFLGQVKPNTAFLSIPIRPPAEKWVQPPSEQVLSRSFNVFKEKIDQVEYLIGYEGNAFSFTGNVEEDILSITSVHPMREEALKDFLKRAKSDWSSIVRLMNEHKLTETEYKGHKFYIRKFPHS